jgi:hypothetical protein
VDTILIAYAQKRAAPRNNALRIERGLSAIPNGWAGAYLTGRYSVIALGGVAPFECPEGIAHIPPHVTAVGALEFDRQLVDINPDSECDNSSNSLVEWLEESRSPNGVVYVCFGTGTTLSNAEVSAVTVDLTHSLLHHFGGREKAPRVLFALRPSEQARLNQVIQNSIVTGNTQTQTTNTCAGPPSASASNNMITQISEHCTEYLDGQLRIEAVVPQSALLQSGHVVLFVSHFGFGSFTEGVSAGVPFVAYPSGLDQYANAKRAIEAGIAVGASHGLTNLGDIVAGALENKELHSKAKASSRYLNNDICAKELVLETVAAVVAKQHHTGNGSNKGAKSATQTKRDGATTTTTTTTTITTTSAIMIATQNTTPREARVMKDESQRQWSSFYSATSRSSGTSLSTNRRRRSSISGSLQQTKIRSFLVTTAD